MSKTINFNSINEGTKEKRPMFCEQDFRDFIGFTIKDVLSDESDCNVYLVLENRKTNESVQIGCFDTVLDGETLFVVDR